jgi:hypothetical protein
MAFTLKKKNNSSIVLNGGLTVKNCIVRFTTNFDRFGNHYYINIYYYKDQSEQVELPMPTDLKKYENVRFEISNEDYANLSPIEVHNRVKTWFEELNESYTLTIV